MPTYDYTENATGKRVELLVPIAQRDQVPGHKRILVPPRLHAHGLAEDPDSMDAQARKGLKECEEKYGRDRIVKESGFTIKQLRQIWAT